MLLGLPRVARGPLDLASVDLVGVRAPEGDFAGADLQFTAPAGADLSGATFDNAEVYDTDLRLACVRKAHFSGGYVYCRAAAAADFSGADLSQACGRPSMALKNATTDASTKLPDHESNRLG